MSASITLLTDGDRVRRVFADALAHIDAEFDVEFPHVVVKDEDDDMDDSLLQTIRANGAYSLVLAEQKLWQSIGDPVYQPETVALSDVDALSETERIETTPVPADDFGNELPDPVVNRLEAETDVVFRRGFGIIKGRVLDAPTYGVLSPHGGDLTKYRGMPSGFWEFLADEPEVGLTMQKLTAELDGGYVCAYDTVDTSNLHTYQEIRAAMDEQTARLWPVALRKLLSSEQLEQPDDLGPLYTTPGLWDSFRYVLKNTRGRVRRRTSRTSPR
jgi:folate-dependent phosphoribosylglycinamide formyltransferase PurN